VDIARFSAPAASPLLSSLSTKRDVDDERFAKLKGAVAQATGGGPLWGAPLHQLGRLSDRLTDEQAELVARELAPQTWIRSPAWAVKVAHDIAAGRAVKMAGRPDLRGAGAGEEPRRFMVPGAAVP
jgi:hypothetical protein